MNLTGFEKFKESKHYIVYLTKDRKDKKTNRNNSSFSSSFIVRGFFSDSYYFGFTFCSFYTI